jgi:hypothetical protein
VKSQDIPDDPFYDSVLFFCGFDVPLHGFEDPAVFDATDRGLTAPKFAEGFCCIIVLGWTIVTGSSTYFGVEEESEGQG